MKRICICDLLGLVDKWAKEDSFPIVKVEYRNTFVEGQVSIERYLVPEHISGASPTEINVGGEEVPLRSIKSIEIEGTCYVIEENI